VSADVNETAAIVHGAKRRAGRAPSSSWAAEPQELPPPDGAADPGGPRIDEAGHDYFLQITDARPDTGGLSGATPAEAVSWGKIDPNRLPDTVVCYLDARSRSRSSRRTPSPATKAPAQAALRTAERLLADLVKAFHDARRGEGVSKRAPKDRVDQLAGRARKPHRGFRSHAAFDARKPADGQVLAFESSFSRSPTSRKLALEP